MVLFFLYSYSTPLFWFCCLWETEKWENKLSIILSLETGVMPASAVISRIFMSSSCVMLTMPTCSLFTQFRWRLISNYFVSSQYLVTFRHYCDFSKSKKFKTMAHSKKIICLFDVDGTLTAPRKVTY